MIKIDRGVEPPELVAEREKRLPKAITAFNTHGPGSARLNKLLDAGYDVVKPTLYRRQHGKCAYCERCEGLAGHPVEHFRPKKLALRGLDERKLIEDTERYWWLTWTWENLLFACVSCNSSRRKGNRFPLRAKSEPLPTHPRPTTPRADFHRLDPRAERPLLLDPADRDIDPLEHLRWLPVDRRQLRSRWTWELRRLTLEGRTTAKIMELDDRKDEVTWHYQDEIWPLFRDEIEALIERTSPRTHRDRLEAAWAAFVQRHVDRRKPLAAATWSMLDVLRTSSAALRAAKLPEPRRP